MINGILAERTVSDVLPALQTNADGLKKVLDDLVKQYQSKQTDLEKWKVGLRSHIQNMLCADDKVEKEQHPSRSAIGAPSSSPVPEAEFTHKTCLTRAGTSTQSFLNSWSCDTCSLTALTKATETGSQCRSLHNLDSRERTFHGSPAGDPHRKVQDLHLCYIIRHSNGLETGQRPSVARYS